MLGSRRRIRYVGHNGPNLGDQAIFQAVQAYCSPLPVEWFIGGKRDQLRCWSRNAVAMLGGGTLIGGAHNQSVDFLQQAFAYAQKKSSRSIVFCTGVEWQENGRSQTDAAWLGKWMELLRRCDFVAVRGVRSAETLRAGGLDPILAGDAAAYFLQPASYWAPIRKRIGVNPVAQDLCWGDQDLLLSELESAVSVYLELGYDVQVFAVNPDDVQLCESFVARIGLTNDNLHLNFAQPRAYLEAVRQCECFIGTRLHSVILALCAGVPSGMLAYNPKCLEIMDSLSCGKYTLRTDECSKDNLTQLLESLFANADDIRGRVLTQLEVFRQQQKNLMRRILEF